jgi:hypothetical protein
MRASLAAFAIASLGLVACGGGATTAVRAPASSPAPAPIAAGSTITVSPATNSLTPEDALLARLEQLQKVDFLRSGSGNGPKRPKVVPTSFKIADLPVVRLFGVPVLEDYKPQQKSPPGQPPKVGSIDPEVVISPQDPKEKIVPGAVRAIHIGLRESPNRGGHGPGLEQLVSIENLRRSPGTGGGKELNERCGDTFGYDRWVPIRWSRVGVEDDGVHVGVGDVVFDRVACSVHTIQRIDSKAAQLVPGGVMYGFLGCGESCQTRESLVVVMPHAATAASASLGGDPTEQLGTFSMIELPIEHGGGGSLVALINGYDISAWHKALTGMDVPPASRPTVMGIEVTQSVRDASPLAIAYVEARDAAPVAQADVPNVVGKFIDLASITIR